MSGQKGSSRAEVHIRQMRAENAERDAWDALEGDRLAKGLAAIEAIEAIDVDELVIPGLDDVEFWNEAERLHGYTPAPDADLGECARIVARRRRENGQP